MPNVGWAVLLVTSTLGDATPTPVTTPRAEYWAGRNSTRDERREHFQRGIDSARALLAVNADDPEGLFWLAANLGAEALEHSKIYALPIIPKMVELLERLDGIAPQYENAAAARTLAILYSVAPPLISVGSNKKARTAFERALTLAPDFPGNLALAANYYDDQGDEERALALAQQCMLTLPHFFRDPEANEWRAIAERIIEDNS